MANPPAVISPEQRAELAVGAVALKQSLAYADLAWRAYRRIKSSPVVAAGLAAAFLALGPGKLLRMGYRSGLLIVGLLRLIRIVRTLR